MGLPAIKYPSTESRLRIINKRGQEKIKKSNFLKEARLQVVEESYRKKRTQYELADHLGNVRASIYDIKFFDGVNYKPQFYSSADYYPFGFQINDRSSNNADSDNTFGFNGKLRDDNLGLVTNYDYGFRIYNPGIARFLSVDPLKNDYAYLTPYQFASNSPIVNIDLDGLEAFSIHGDVRVSSFLTLSTSAGIIFDLEGNVGIFITPGAGLGYIGGASAATGATVFPFANTIYDTKGWGISAVASGFLELGVSGSVDLAFNPTTGEYDLGATGTIGAGLEAGAAGEATYTWIFGKTWKEIGDYITGQSSEEQENYRNDLRKIKLELNNSIESINQEINSLMECATPDCDEIDRLGNKLDKLNNTIDSVSGLESIIIKESKSTDEPELERP